MDIDKLFVGIAIIVDDEVGNKNANINNLLKQIEIKKIPYISYKELPDGEVIRHLGESSFIILDWKLQQENLEAEIGAGVKMPESISKDSIQENIDFLKLLIKNYFGPIFIFTNEDKESVIKELKEKDLYHDDRPNVILVKNKSDLTDDNKLFEEIELWLKKTPSIYVLKQWESGYRNAKNLLFQDFYERSPFWPIVLWNSYKSDGTNMSRELGDIITRNLYTRMAPFSFESAVLEVAATCSNQEEVRCVLEGERFIKGEQLNKDEIFTGDIFHGETDGRYLLNIRAQCDLVRDKNPELYCLKGRVIDENTINTEEGIPFQNGEFREKKTHAIVSCIDDGKIIEFLFQDLKIKKWNELKEKRIGRLLPPYITRIQQQYSLYFQRQGLPRTPDEALPLPNLESTTKNMDNHDGS